jgi:hypothetical protein
MEGDSKLASSHTYEEVRKSQRDAETPSIAFYFAAPLVGLAFLLWGAVFG